MWRRVFVAGCAVVAVLAGCSGGEGAATTTTTTSLSSTSTSTAGAPTASSTTTSPALSSTSTTQPRTTTKVLIIGTATALGGITLAGLDQPAFDAAVDQISATLGPPDERVGQGQSGRSCGNHARWGGLRFTLGLHGAGWAWFGNVDNAGRISTTRDNSDPGFKTGHDVRPYDTIDRLVALGGKPTQKSDGSLDGATFGDDIYINVNHDRVVWMESPDPTCDGT